MTEKEKMLAGHIYDACNPEILSELFATQDAVFEYNQIRPTDRALRTEKIKQILGKTGEIVIINQPFHCDYGSHISVGEDFFANFNLTVLDEAPVTIGNNCFIGPNVGLYTACHPTNPVARNSRQEWAEPIIIGHNVWIGGGVTVLPGVTIGDNVTIGAGSVAVGNPCRPVKWLEESEQDSQ